jgi:metal-responsive CopG/Arc/MetJ family transcriptional regulator
MRQKERAAHIGKPGDTPSVRATISFPTELYKALEDIAAQKKVSLAWVVRDATERYIADKWPLLASPHHD